MRPLMLTSTFQLRVAAAADMALCVAVSPASKALYLTRVLPVLYDNQAMRTGPSADWWSRSRGSSR